MLTRLVRRCARLGRALARALQQRLLIATKPSGPAVAAGALTDLVRSRPALVAENALLRQQLLVLGRSVTRPRCTPADRALLVLLASCVRAWRHALVIVQPETVLRWHRQLFRLAWRWRSRGKAAPSPKVAVETIALIREMAAANQLWSAERICGELRKLGIRVAKTTVQRHMRDARPPRSAGQPWGTFLRNHAHEIWACDFLPVTDLLFQPLYAFVVVALGSRRVVHVGVTRHPTDAWVAQQLREVTPFEQRPRYLIRDNDSKYGRPSRAWPRRAASPSYARPTALHGRMPPASASSGAFGANASTICWCWAKGICGACCGSMRATSISTGPIRACVSLSPTRQREERPKQNGMGGLARSRSSAACTMPIGEPRDPPDEPDGQHSASPRS